MRRLGTSPVAPTVTDFLGEFFSSYLAPPTDAEVVPADDSPREASPYLLRYSPAVTLTTLLPQRVGDRVETNDATWELLGHPRQLRHGRRVVGVEVAVNNVETLYPYTASLQENGGQVVRADVRFAMWGMTEGTTSRGGYEDVDAEADVSHRSDLLPNRLLVIDGSRFHIVRSWVPPTGPRVRLVLRRKDATSG